MVSYTARNGGLVPPASMIHTLNGTRLSKTARQAADDRLSATIKASAQSNMFLCSVYHQNSIENLIRPTLPGIVLALLLSESRIRLQDFIDCSATCTYNKHLILRRYGASAEAETSVDSGRETQWDKLSTTARTSLGGSRIVLRRVCFRSADRLFSDPDWIRKH